MLKKYQHKSLLYGKTDMHLLNKQTRSVFHKHGSADAVAICMLLLQWTMSAILYASGVRFPFPVRRDSSVG